MLIKTLNYLWIIKNVSMYILGNSALMCPYNI